MSQLFASGGQSIGASTSVLPMSIQGWFPLGWTICLLAVQGTLPPNAKLQIKDSANVLLVRWLRDASIPLETSFTPKVTRISSSLGW